MANMTIDTLDNGIIRVQITGRLDVASAEELELEFTASLVPITAHAVVDLAGVDFIGSMALRTFITCAKALARKHGKLVLFGAQPAVQQVLEIAALNAIMPIVSDLESAVSVAL
jgi:anti-sigma B factor antagonist